MKEVLLSPPSVLAIYLIIGVLVSKYLLNKLIITASYMLTGNGAGLPEFIALCFVFYPIPLVIYIIDDLIRLLFKVPRLH